MHHSHYQNNHHHHNLQRHNGDHGPGYSRRPGPHPHQSHPLSHGMPGPTQREHHPMQRSIQQHHYDGNSAYEHGTQHNGMNNGNSHYGHGDLHSHTGDSYEGYNSNGNGPWFNQLNQIQLDRHLLNAASSGEDDRVQKLIESGANLDYARPFGTPLVQAARHGHHETVSVLIKEGAEKYRTDRNGRTALHWAIANRDQKMIEVLWKTSSDANRNSQHGTALQFAAKLLYPDIVELLLKKGARSSSCLPHFATPLLEALKAHALDRRTPNRCTDTVRVLMRHCNVNARTAAGNTPLALAARSNLVPVVKMLLDNGAEINTRNNEGQSPLIYAIENGRGANRNAICTLVERGCDTRGALEAARRHRFGNLQDVLQPPQANGRAIPRQGPTKGAKVLHGGPNRPNNTRSHARVISNSSTSGSSIVSSPGSAGLRGTRRVERRDYGPNYTSSADFSLSRRRPKKKKSVGNMLRSLLFGSS